MSGFYAKSLIIRLVLFVVILAALAVLEIWDLEHSQLQALWNASLALLAEKSILLFHGLVTRTGNQLIDPVTNKSVLVLGGCNGVEVSVMLIAAMFVYPSRLKAKVWGVVTGLFAVQFLNILRIVSLYYLNIWDEEIFRFAHLYLWQSLIMLDVIGVLLIWLKWQRVVCKLA